MMRPRMTEQPSRSRGGLRSSIVILVAYQLFGGCTASEEPRVNSLRIEMTGEDFKWTSRYAGPDGEPQTPDDFSVSQVLTVPQGADVEIQLRSNDFVYSLEVPHKDLAEIAVPDMTFSLRFRAEEVGVYSLPGQQLCGYAHPDLMAKLVVVSQSEFSDWQSQQAISN